MNNNEDLEQNKKRRICREIIEWLIYLAIFVLILWGTPKVLVKVLKTEYPIATITSSSMWPVLKEGDIVLIQGVTNKNEISKDDIVVFTNQKEMFTIHRVIRLRENDLITQGDANNLEDAPIKYDQVIGKAVMLGDQPFRIPWLGKLSNLFKR